MLKIAVVSDIHLGHKRNDTASIISALNKAFPFDASSAELDIIFLAGDVFDRLLELPQNAVTEITLWVHRLIELCSTYKIKLRVLEGTASHDWKQSELFLTVAKISKLPIDISYISTVSIEYFEEYDINVLYMPDDWNYDTNNTLIEIKELMLAKSLTTVDIGIFHGNFEYQLPPAAKHAPCHDSTEYLKLVKGLIFIGHNHTYSNKDRIYAQGSFDRLTHGAEEPKGHVRASIEKDSYTVEFIENKLARKYITFKCLDYTLDEIITRLRFVEDLPENSCVRLQAKPNNPALSDMSVYIRKYPMIVWSKDVKDKEAIKQEQELVHSQELNYHSIQIDKQNIEELLMQRLAKAKNSALILQIAKSNLLELK